MPRPARKFFQKRKRQGKKDEFLWLISLSDLMILLFIFFVVLFAFTYQKVKSSDLARILTVVTEGEQGKTDIEKIIKISIDNIKPFKFNLEGVGVFPNHKYIKIIWIGIKNSEIIEKISKILNDKITKSIHDTKHQKNPSLSTEKGEGRIHYTPYPSFFENIG